jgi:hypothetical protein
MRGLQGDGKMGDADACAMGEGLKVNISLEELELVSILCCFCFISSNCALIGLFDVCFSVR